MKIKYLHSWNITYKEAINIQQELKGKLILDNKQLPGRISTIAGADISYSKQNDMFFAAIALLAYPTMDVMEEISLTERAPFPYIPGLLSFREGPALLKAFEKLTRVPDCVIFDGQGIAHPRGIGLASHMGLFLDIPTIGCAKKRLVGVHDEVGDEAGDYADLMLDGRILGAVVRTKKKVKPLFISPGHKIDLQRAIDVVLSCCRGYRLTEPVRRAHLAVNRIRIEATTSC
ncbi:MAG: deoxyribonuclease V [Syntrophales bacterium]|jgi:deoxyribonuclease V